MPCRGGPLSPPVFPIVPDFQQTGRGRPLQSKICQSDIPGINRLGTNPCTVIRGESGQKNPQAEYAQAGRPSRGSVQYDETAGWQSVFPFRRKNGGKFMIYGLSPENRAVREARRFQHAHRLRVKRQKGKKQKSKTQPPTRSSGEWGASNIDRTIHWLIPFASLQDSVRGE